MKRSSLAWRTVAVVGTSAIVLAGCGGGSDDTTAAEPSSPATESSSSATSDGGAAPAGAECEPATPEPAEGDGVLNVGALLPQTGQLQSLGPPEFAGVQLAVEEINAAGGYNGQDVGYFPGDQGDTTTDVASQTVTRLVGEDVDVLIGAAASGATLNVLDQVSSAGVLMLSPANTSPELTCAEDRGLYFRTAPSDVLQGRVLGEVIVGEDGFTDVSIMARDDSYGTGLAGNIQTSVEDGGGTVLGDGPVIYNPDAPNYSAEVSQVAEAAPEALVVIGYDELLRIVPELVAQGIGPADGVQLYLVDGNVAQYSAEGLAPGTLAGTKGTLPGAEATADFQQRLIAIDPTIEDPPNFSYAAEAYDGVIVTALAAAVAGDDSGASIAAEAVGVTRDGEACTTYADCLALVEAGTDVDYDGLSGPIEMSPLGDVTAASVGVVEYDEANDYTFTDYVEGNLD